MQSLYRVILKRRTIRFFKNKKIPFITIRKIINAARVAPSAANLQFIEYLIVDKQPLKEKIFICTKWGGYVYPKRVPPKDKRPSFYIIILVNKNKTKKPDIRDIGSAVENILLACTCLGLGGCWIGSLDKRRLRKTLNIPDNFIIDCVIACGIPDEHPILEERSDTVKYWLDKNNRLHVPKRPLREILHYNSLINRE